MTREFRLMLAEQGAAGPELMGAGMTAPKSAAEVMRDEAVTRCRAIALVTKKRAFEFAGRKRVTFLTCALTAEECAGFIGKIPIPADPRDAEIARLKTENMRLCEALMEIDTFATAPASLVVSAWSHLGAISAKARAALAQSGEAG